MMHEYAKGIRHSQRSNSGNNFIVKKFRNLNEVYACVERYQEDTVTHFIKYNRDKQFGNEVYIPNVERGRIHYWSHTGKSGVPIEYDGVPFMHVGRYVLMCHQGQDVNKRHKEKYQLRRSVEYQESGITPKTRNRSMVSKKVNCPAEIYITHVMKFPQHKVPSALLAVNSLPTDHMRKLAKKKIIDSFNSCPKKFMRESWYYVRLPDPASHEGHPVLGLVKNENCNVIAENAVDIKNLPEPNSFVKKRKRAKNSKYRTKEPVDPRVLQKMYELTRQGVSTVKMMQAAIAVYVEEELFNSGKPPPAMYRRYNPTPSDIQNAMYKVKQEMRLEGKSILQYRCAALVREITELVVQTDNDDYLHQLEEQLRNIYNAVKNTLPIQQIQNKSDQEDETPKIIYMDSSVPMSSDVDIRPRRGRRRKISDTQAELNAATYNLSLENQVCREKIYQVQSLHEPAQNKLPHKEQSTALEAVFENQHVHEIIEQEDGTVTEVYYYQPIENSDQYDTVEANETGETYQDTTIIHPPLDIKVESPSIEYYS
ncbi:hypothetical protein SK128_016274 [Halocaridina rubra]|uniref:Uncharacterized protein n=1 Tax=Halocaridina rubra TaxID=373956 RepID=A0AAN8X049_HALRR